MKYLTTLITLFYFTGYTHCAVFLQNCENEISEYSHYAGSIHYYSNEICDYAHYGVFTFTTIKMKSLTTLTTLFGLTTLKMISLTMLTTLFYFHYY